MVLASLGFVISLGILNVDAFIVKQNIQREIRGATDQTFAQGRADLDAQYFLDLSDDAIPPLVSAFHSKSLPVSVQEKIGAALACKQYERRQETATYPWQSFHFSRWQADAKLRGLTKELEAYQMIDKDWPFHVKTPAGEELACHPSYD